MHAARRSTGIQWGSLTLRTQDALHSGCLYLWLSGNIYDIACDLPAAVSKGNSYFCSYLNVFLQMLWNLILKGPVQLLLGDIHYYICI